MYAFSQDLPTKDSIYYLRHEPSLPEDHMTLYKALLSTRVSIVMLQGRQLLREEPLYYVP